MSRRHKENDLDKPSFNFKTDHINIELFPEEILDLFAGYFTNRIINSYTSKSQNEVRTYNNPIIIVDTPGLGISKIESKYLDYGPGTCDLMYVDIKQEHQPFSAKDILQKEIDKILDANKKVEDKHKRGRPIIKRLCEKISDSNVVKMAKKCYMNIYRKALKMAQNITQYLVCFLYSLFDLPDNETETVYGKVSYFHRIMSSIKGIKIPTVRMLQDRLKWFMEWRAAVIRTAKEMKEEKIHRAWEKLVERIKRQFEFLIPQYAMC